MNKRIVVESLVICWLILLIPSSSAIEFESLNHIPITRSRNLDADAISSNEQHNISYEKKSTHVIVPGDGNTTYYAIVAGCSEYEDSRYNLPSIGKPFPESTMKYVYDVLLNASNWENANIILLLNEEATKQNILDAFTTLSVSIDGDDVFLFSWNGHGTQVEDIDGDDGDGTDEAICPYDIKIEGEELVNIITDDELDSYFSMIAAEGLFILFESCMSGGLVDNDDSQHSICFVDVNEARRVVVMSTPPDKLGFGWFRVGWPMLMLYSVAFTNASCDIDQNGWISAEEAFQNVDESYSSYEKDLFLDYYSRWIPIATLSIFLRIHSVLKKLNIEPKLNFIVSTLSAGFWYLFYQTNIMKSFFLEMMKMEFMLLGAENNPNICDGYVGDLDIVKIY